MMPPLVLQPAGPEEGPHHMEVDEEEVAGEGAEERVEDEAKPAEEWKGWPAAWPDRPMLERLLKERKEKEGEREEEKKVEKEKEDQKKEKEVTEEKKKV